MIIYVFVEYLHRYQFSQPTLLKSAYGRFNIEVVGSKVYMTSNIVPNIYFLLIAFEFKSNFTDKYFINNIINPVNDKFIFKPRLNSTHMNSSFESDKFGHTI